MCKRVPQFSSFFILIIFWVFLPLKTCESQHTHDRIVITVNISLKKKKKARERHRSKMFSLGTEVSRRCCEHFSKGPGCHWYIVEPRKCLLRSVQRQRLSVLPKKKEPQRLTRESERWNLFETKTFASQSGQKQRENKRGWLLIWFRRENTGFSGRVSCESTSCSGGRGAETSTCCMGAFLNLKAWPPKLLCRLLPSEKDVVLSFWGREQSDFKKDILKSTVLAIWS